MKFLYKLLIKSIVAATLFTMLFSCGNNISDIHQISEKDTLPNEQAKDITLYFSDSGKTKVKLTAPLMRRYSSNDDNTELPQGLFMTFYDSIGQVESTLEADYGIRYEKDLMTEVKYNVVILTSDSEEVYTDRLIWDEKKGKIYSDEFVKIVSPEKVIWGNGFESDENMEKYHIIKIKGEILIEDMEKENK